MGYLHSIATSELKHKLLRHISHLISSLALVRSEKFGRDDRTPEVSLAVTVGSGTWACIRSDDMNDRKHYHPRCRS